MRSLAEIRFRLAQELGNLWMLANPPRLGTASAVRLGCPDGRTVAGRLRGTAYAAEVERLAALDPVINAPSDLRYFRRIPYLDFEKVGDHKAIWEPNRHQHLVLLAQASLLTGRPEYAPAIERHLDSWYRGNPWLRGINWTSALEVAFRALSWLWVDHLVGDRLRGRRRLLEELFRHGCYLERNLSLYFSPNTHLLGEAVALHALGTAYPDWPRAARWRETGAQILDAESRRQVRPDGSYFEQSTYYHVYALDLFLLHAVLSGKVGPHLAPMADFLAVLLGPARELPFLGDDDGGRLFHPYGKRERFGRATLATAAAVLGRSDLPVEPEDSYEQACWWIGAAPAGRVRPASRLFPDAGLAVMVSGDVHAVFDAGPFGPGGAGHSHSDTLSLVVRVGEERILIDPGTYTYVAGAGWREAFRGSAAHNTLRLDGRNQATPAGPFRWMDKPEVKLLEVVRGPGDRPMPPAPADRGL